MTDALNVGVAEIKVSCNSDILASFGLGSCVAVAMFDPLRKVGGLAHIMLPESKGREAQSPGKFADTAVVKLVEELLRLGARQSRLRCKIAGGAQMFEIPGARKGESGVSASNIGARNVEAVKKALDEKGIPLVGEDTGGNYGRTVKFYSSTGELEITSIYHGRAVL